MMKKIIILIFMTLGVLFSGYSADVYLTSCSAQTWNTGDTYYINLTNPSIESGSSCFSGSMEGVQFIQLNEQIEIYSTSSYAFFSGNIINDSTFTDLNLKYNSGAFYNRVFNSNNFNYNTIENSRFEGMAKISYVSGYFGNNQKHNVILNSEFYNVRESIFYQYGTSSSAGNMGNNTAIDSFFSMGASGQWQGSSGFYQGGGLTNYLGGCVLTRAIGGADTTTNVNLVADVIYLDDNGDNFADGTPTRFITREAGVPSNNFLFLQNYEAGVQHMDTSKVNVFLTDEDLSGANLINLDNDVADFSFTGLSSTSQFFNIQLWGDSKIQCDIGVPDSSPDYVCSLDFSPSTTTAQTFRPSIAIINENNEVSFINVLRNGIGNNHLIANGIDQIENNVNINYNSLQAYTNPSTELIKLKANNIKIDYNDFLVFSATDSDVYTYLNIEGTDQLTNLVRDNLFENSIVSPVNPSQIFNDNCDVLFYNNRVAENVIISNTCNEVIVNVERGFYNENNNKIYYFNVGNYYSDNVACVDADTNGICDSPYISGNITDLYPLSSYPFEFESHLFTAVSVVDVESFIVSLHGITDTQTILLNDLNEGIVLSYSHNSEFEDLSCSYILDGSTIETQNNVLKDIQNDFIKYNWIEKTYSLRVSCDNEFISPIQSSEITFTISLTDNGDSGGTGETGDGDGDGGTTEPVSDFGGIETDGDFGLTGVFTTDIEESSENLNGIFTLFEQPLGYGLMFGAIAIFLGFFTLIFAFARGFIR